MARTYPVPILPKCTPPHKKSVNFCRGLTVLIFKHFKLKSNFYSVLSFTTKTICLKLSHLRLTAVFKLIFFGTFDTIGFIKLVLWTKNSWKPVSSYLSPKICYHLMKDVF